MIRCNNKGRPACRNVAKGGDAVKTSEASEDVFMTYMVYRSFKYPPQGPVKRICT